MSKDSQFTETIVIKEENFLTRYGTVQKYRMQVNKQALLFITTLLCSSSTVQKFIRSSIKISSVRIYVCTVRHFLHNFFFSLMNSERSHATECRLNYLSCIAAYFLLHDNVLHVPKLPEKPSHSCRR